MAILLIGDYTRVDFQHPVEMTQPQFKQFVDGLKIIFDEKTVYSYESWEFRDANRRLGDYFPRESLEDYELQVLIMPISTDQKSKKLGRTFMSIRMKECEWLPLYLRYCEINKKNQFDIETIRSFLKWQEDEKKKRAEERSKYGSVFACKKCGREYLKSRFSNPQIKTPGYCDYEAEKLIEKRIEKEKIEKLKFDGKIKESYDF